MYLWHVAYFIDARFDTLSSLLFIFLGIPQAVMSRSSRMASLQLLTLLFFFFFFFFTVSKSIDVSKPHAAESLDINLIQVFYLILSDFFFLFSEPSDIVCIFHRGCRISEAVGTRWSSGRVVPHLGTRETRSASLSGMATETRLRLSWPKY